MTLSSAMTSTIRALVLSCLATFPFELASFPFEVRAQATLSMPVELGLIPEGEERSVELRGRLNLETASPTQSMGAVQRIRFSVAQSSGFCVALRASSERTMLSLVGREREGTAVLFDLSTAPTGIAPGDGRRTVLQTIAPIAETTLLLEAVVGQTARAPGDALTVFVRAYPDRTPRNQLPSICGPALR